MFFKEWLVQRDYGLVDLVVHFDSPVDHGFVAVPAPDIDGFSEACAFKAMFYEIDPELPVFVAVAHDRVEASDFFPC